MLETCPVIQRFQIEDLVFQDSAGVVFRALDKETDKMVCLRRFFPFGASGGGLSKAERVAYDVAVERLATVRHPAFSAVICGGCDPIDGMPFMATEWIEGNTLKSFIDRAPLTPSEAANLLRLALEVCQVLSEVLTEEAIWVETSLESIIVGTDEAHRGFTFWICPLKWLGQNGGQHGLECIVTLTEQVLGWERQVISDQSGLGLGAWLKWLRTSVNIASHFEVREILAQSVGNAAPTPTIKLANQELANRPIVIRKKKKSSGILIVTAILVIIAGGGLAFIQWRDFQNKRPSPLASEKSTPTLESSQNKRPSPLASEKTTPILEPSEKPAPVTAPLPAPDVVEKVTPAPQETKGPVVPEETPEQRASRKAAELMASTAAPEKPKPQNSAPPPPPVSPPVSPPVKTQVRIRVPAPVKAPVPASVPAAEIFTHEDNRVLITKEGKEVTLEGTLKSLVMSPDKTLLLLGFSPSPPEIEVRGGIVLGRHQPKGILEELRLLMGKNIRIHGKVKIQSFGGTKLRPLIIIESRAAIEEVK